MELFFGTVPDFDDGIPGTIMAIHAFGDYAKFHPRLHAIVADGLFGPGGAFHSLPDTDPKQLEGIFRSGTENQPSPDSPKATVLDVSDCKPRRIPSRTWRELVKKIREADPPGRPRCHHETKIVGPINQPEAMERILRHPGLRKRQTAPSGRKAKAPQHGPVVIGDFDDGRPGYEEPLFATGLRPRRQPPPAATGAVCPRVRPAPSTQRSRPRERLAPTSLTLVGKSRRKRAGNVLDTPRHTCYSKTVGKRFPITLSPITSPKRSSCESFL